MNKQDVIDFFDKCAVHWDEHMVKNEDVIHKILDHAGVTEGKSILDVACGTGVLFDDYLKRNVASVTGIDISSEMVRLAKSKFTQDNVNVICGDVENMDCETLFDCIVVYNAFPHFPDPDALIKKLSSMLKPGGILTVAHGMSRKMLDKHHSGSASKVSNRLMSEDELAEIFGKYLKVTVKISDDTMYQVAGIKQ